MEQHSERRDHKQTGRIGPHCEGRNGEGACVYRRGRELYHWSQNACRADTVKGSFGNSSSRSVPSMSLQVHPQATYIITDKLASDILSFSASVLPYFVLGILTSPDTRALECVITLLYTPLPKS